MDAAWLECSREVESTEKEQKDRYYITTYTIPPQGRKVTTAKNPTPEFKTPQDIAFRFGMPSREKLGTHTPKLCCHPEYLSLNCFMLVIRIDLSPAV